MNDTREELLQNLKYVQNMAIKMENVVIEYIQMERNFIAKQKGINATHTVQRSRLGTPIIVTMSLVSMLGILLSMIYQSFQILRVGGTMSFAAKVNGQGILLLFLLGISIALIYRYKDRESVFKTIVLCFLVLLLLLAVSYWSTLIVILMVISVAAIVSRGKKKEAEMQQKRMESYNKERTVNRSMMVQQKNNISSQYQKLCNEVTQNTKAWYPPKYYCVDAINFFVEAVVNYRADSVKELVNLYEQTEHYRKMENYAARQVQQLDMLIAGQQQIKRELQFANLLNAAQLFQQSRMNDNIRANTDAIYGLYR